jgi:hypothetical protein
MYAPGRDPELRTLRRSTRPTHKYMVQVGTRWIHFGARKYPQYRDATPLKLYASKDHLDKARRDRYYSRHGPAVSKLSAKYWSHKYLWPCK